MDDNFKGFNQQQEALNAMITGWKNPMEGFNRQQEALNAMVTGWKNPMEGFNRQQEALNAMITGWKNPVEGFNRQQEALNAMITGWKNPMEGFNQQQEAIQKIIASIGSTTKTHSFDLNASLLAMNDAIIGTYNDVESKESLNLSQNEQELIIWSHEQIDFFSSMINSLRNMRNTLDTKWTFGHLLVLLGLIGNLLTILGSIQGNEIEINIHNNYNDVIIESETDGNKTDIFIEKKESPLELQIENGDERYSGGEST